MRSANKNILSESIDDTNIHYSEVLDLFSIYGYSIHSKWAKDSGTVAGTLKVQVSNDPEAKDNPDNAQWKSLDCSEVAVSDGDGEHFYNIGDIYYRFMRIYYQLSSGAITVNNYFNSKGI